MLRKNYKYEQAIKGVCTAYGVHPRQTALLVCEHRACIYILNVGEIDRPHCIIDGIPNNTYKSQHSGWRSICIPNGWTCAVVQDKCVWKVEVNYFEQTYPSYRYTKLNSADGSDLHIGPWCTSPARAYKEAHLEKIRNTNGSRSCGVVYDLPQAFLRYHFQSRRFTGEIKTSVDRWLYPHFVYQNEGSIDINHTSL